MFTHWLLILLVAMTDSLWMHLPDVEVTASLQKDVIAPQTLSDSSLREMSSLSVADAIRYFSGVQLKDYGGVGGIKTLDVRSMGSQHTGVYYNGVLLGNAQNGQTDLGRFSLDNLESIELYNGQRSDILQSAREFAQGGSVYLTTRRPRFKSKERVHAYVQMAAGSFGRANPSAGVDIRLAEGLSLSVNGAYMNANGRYRFRYRRVTPDGQVAYDTTAVRHNGDIEAYRVEVSLNHYYSNTGMWRAHGYLYGSERGVPGAIVNNVWRNGERMQDRNSFVQAQWQDQFFRIWTLRLNAKYANDYTHYRNLDPRLLPADNRYTQQEAYISLVSKWQILSMLDASVSYDLDYNHLRRAEHLSGDTASFSRLSHFASAALALNVQDYMRLQASVLLTATEKPSHRAYDLRVTPGVFVSIYPFGPRHTEPYRDLSINIFYKQSYRQPTFNDLYYTEMGSTNLRPELARQRNIGLSYNLCPSTSQPSTFILKLSADYYYNRVSDKIIAYPKGQQFRWTMLNLGEVKIHGVDLKADGDWQLGRGFSLTAVAQYSFQQALDVTNPSDTYYRHQIPYIPRHSGTFAGGLNYHHTRYGAYGLRYSFTYVGERYAQQENTAYNYVQPWYTHDMAVFGEWHIPAITNHPSSIINHTLRATLSIQNLLGQDYEVIRNYPMPKQQILCTIRYEL